MEFGTCIHIFLRMYVVFGLLICYIWKNKVERNFTFYFVLQFIICQMAHAASTKLWGCIFKKKIQYWLHIWVESKCKKCLPAFKICKEVQLKFGGDFLQPAAVYQSIQIQFDACTPNMNFFSILGTTYQVVHQQSQMELILPVNTLVIG